MPLPELLSFKAVLHCFEARAAVLSVRGSDGTWALWFSSFNVRDSMSPVHASLDVCRTFPVSLSSSGAAALSHMKRVASLALAKKSEAAYFCTVLALSCTPAAAASIPQLCLFPAAQGEHVQLKPLP